MINTFYNQALEFRQETLSLLKDFDTSILHKKECYAGQFQKYVLVGQIVTIEFYQNRLYENRMPFRTQCTGDLMLHIYDKNDNECLYKFEDFKKILEWDFPERTFRLIVPSNLLSEKIIKGFTLKIIMGDLPTVSKDSYQFVYYTDLDGGEVLLEYYPSIINEIKPE